MLKQLSTVLHSTAEDPLLILSGNVGRLLSVPHGLTLVNLKSNRVNFVPTLKAVTEMAYDANRQEVYFTDGEAIYRLRLNSVKNNKLFGIGIRTTVEQVVKSGGKVPQNGKYQRQT